jgi:hypothetical protein
MTVSRKVELISGILTGLLALTVSCTLALPRSVLQFVNLLPFYLGPALLVAVGSYFHAVRQKTSGLVMLLVGGSILTIMIYPVTFGGFYIYGHRGGLLGLASAMAILTMIAALQARRSAAKE